MIHKTNYASDSLTKNLASLYRLCSHRKPSKKCKRNYKMGSFAFVFCLFFVFFGNVMFLKMTNDGNLFAVDN